MKIIRDTSLTKEQRVDKVKQAMLGNETEAERAGFCCEYCSPFLQRDGFPYLEAFLGGFSMLEKFF